LHPAAGTETISTIPATTWAITAGYGILQLDPYEPGGTSITYTEPPPVPPPPPPLPPATPTALLLTAHAEEGTIGWPISLPDNYGNAGSTPTGGEGLKKADPGASAPSGEFSVSLTDNPASSTENATITGIPGRTAELLVLDVLGKTIQKIDAVTIGGNGTSVPLDVSQWPSGNYIIEAIGDEGSHARAMLSVFH
ncbi:MAG TPA: hypothetical protein VFH95_10100, partial [Candidatus Kapabacteria bacterium]|nr:hypothetical protein [Candidatus Kapabacteria bacterium]